MFQDFKMENFEEIKQEETFPPQPSSKKKYFIIGAVFIVIIGVGILWLVLAKQGEETRQYNIGEKALQEFAESFDEEFASLQKEIDTSDWQTYRNEEFGFEVKYPEDWNRNFWEGPRFSTLSLSHPSIAEYLEETGGELATPHGIGMSIYETEKTIDEFIAEQYGSPSEDGMSGIVEKENKQFPSGQDGVFIRYLTPHGSIPAMLLTNNDNDVIIVVSTFRDGYSLNIPSYSEDVFNQILSTFRFIKSDEKINWKTFRSEKFGFEIKYPPTWKANLSTNQDSNMKVEFNTGIPTSQDNILPDESIIVGMTDRTLEEAKAEFNAVSSEFINEIKDFELDGEKAVRVRYEIGFNNIETITAVHNGKAYIISTGGSMFESDMISTFRFIE